MEPASSSSLELIHPEVVKHSAAIAEFYLKEATSSESASQIARAAVEKFCNTIFIPSSSAGDDHLRLGIQSLVEGLGHLAILGTAEIEAKSFEDKCAFQEDLLGRVLKDYNKSLYDLEAAREKISSLEAALHQSETILADTQVQLTKSNYLLDSVHAELNSLKSNLAESKSQLRNSFSIVSTLQAQLSEMNFALELTRAELNISKSKLVQLQAELQEETFKKDKHDKAASALRQELEALATSFSEQENLIIELKQNNSALGELVKKNEADFKQKLASKDSFYQEQIKVLRKRSRSMSMKPEPSS